MSSQTLLAPTIITKESLVILENNLVAANRVNRRFENQFVKIGNQLTIRKPNRFTVNSGPSLQVQDINEPSVTLTIGTQQHVDWQFTSQDLTLTIEEFSERYLKPAMAGLANAVDVSVLNNYSAISNLVGTPGVTPSAFSTSVQLVGRRMDDNGCPQDNRTLVLNPNAYWSLAGGQTNLFVMPTAKDALVKGYLGTIGNYEVYTDQNVPNLVTGIHNSSSLSATSGTYAGSTVVYAGATGSSDSFAVGEVITFSGIFNINSQNRQSTGILKNFTVNATTAAASGAASSFTINFSPAMVSSGPYQNVTGQFSSNTLSILSTVGNIAAASTIPQNMAFTRDCIGLVMVPMEIPGGVDYAARENYRNISMRVIRAYDINNDVFPTRLDILYGTTVFYDELGSRLTG